MLIDIWYHASMLSLEKLMIREIQKNYSVKCLCLAKISESKPSQ